MDYSVIVPVYNEVDNLKKLDDEIKAVMNKLGSFEIIYVDDGSTDGSKKLIKKLSKSSIVLQRNYGQATALDAGFRKCEGEIVITMDADLQNDPLDIIKLLDKMKEGYDVVAGWRVKRKDAVKFKIITLVARFLRKRLINDGVHDSGCTLRVYKKKAVKQLDLHGEMHRFIIALLKWKGFEIAEVAVNHRSRHSGVSKYKAGKAVKGFVDLLYIWFIMKYASRPLHLFGGLGLGSFFFGMIGVVWIAYQKLNFNTDLSDNAWFLVTVFLLLTGVMLFCFGVVLDLLLRIHFDASKVERRYEVE